MPTTQRLTPRFLGALLAALAAGVLAEARQPAPGQGGKGELFPGARLLHKFPDEVYRVPTWLPTRDGPRLLVWADAADPAPVTKPYFDKPPAPRFDLTIWDAAAGKPLHKLSSAKDNAPPSPVAPAVLPYAFLPGQVGALALSPDGKLLASVTATYRQVPGKIVHERQAEIRLNDLAAGRWRPAVPTKYKGESGPHVLFAPDGALVILAGATGSIQEPGKAKPRRTFRLARSKWYANNPIYYGVRDAVLSPDGSRLAVAADGWVTVYDTTTGKQVFQASRAAPEDKTGRGVGQRTERAALAFSPAEGEEKLLSVETVTGVPKNFVLARLFDLKTKKQMSRRVLAEHKATPGALGQGIPQWGPAQAYFTPKGEPRVLFIGSLIDGASGKVLHPVEVGVGLLVSPDGRYLVRLTRGQEKKMGVEVWGLGNGK